MGDLSAHLDSVKDKKIRCQGKNCCGGTCAIDARVASGFEKLRDIVGKHLKRIVPLTINSGFRCLTHNCRPVKEGGVGSNPDSQHPRGRAIDLATPAGLTPSQFAALAEQVPEFAGGGIGTYRWGIHVDVAAGPRRWKG